MTTTKQFPHQQPFNVAPCKNKTKNKNGAKNSWWAKKPI